MTDTERKRKKGPALHYYDGSTTGLQETRDEPASLSANIGRVGKGIAAHTGFGACVGEGKERLETCVREGLSGRTDRQPF